MTPALALETVGETSILPENTLEFKALIIKYPTNVSVYLMK